MNDVGFAGGDFECEKEMRQFGVVNRFKPIGTRLAAGNFGSALAKGACQEGFVSVDGQTPPAAGELGDFFCGVGIEMGCIDGAVPHVKKLTAFGGDNFTAIGSPIG